MSYARIADLLRERAEVNREGVRADREGPSDYFGEAMTDEALLQLALQACHDRTAQGVLGDAVLESGWGDERVTLLMKMSAWELQWASLSYGYFVQPVRSPMRALNLSRKHARNPTRRWCRAVAAVLLFQDFQTGRYGFKQLPTPRLESMAQVLRQLYPPMRADDYIFRESPLMSMIPRGQLTVTSVDRGGGTLTVSQQWHDEVVNQAANQVQKQRQRGGLFAPTELRTARRR